MTHPLSGWPPRPRSSILDREIEVIELLAAGRSNEDIATALAIGPRTVESHLRRLFARYSVDNRTALAMLAIGEGWIERPSA